MTELAIAITFERANTKSSTSVQLGFFSVGLAAKIERLPPLKHEIHATVDRQPITRREEGAKAAKVPASAVADVS